MGEDLPLRRGTGAPQRRRRTTRGLETSVANGRSLPFPDGVFAAVWTMSTLLHVPNRWIHDVVGELVRVSAPGAPIAVGLWSGDDVEVLNPEDLDEPRRFFSRRSDDTVQRIFGEHGDVVRFQTWPEGKGTESGPGAGQWTQHYQFLVLRRPPLAMARSEFAEERTGWHAKIEQVEAARTPRQSPSATSLPGSSRVRSSQSARWLPSLSETSF
ncbi:methyltransferase domain-containing protein [Arthrobacter sp. ISL-65]|uniref:methyltransferase domain-containing protein n=1 Tax=Arthrobacter sp. ISL-65 TaxID=2819112 RepID=UPI001BEBFCBE|nr:methyltransferase domain-containing protein [Arthrobacter sp. ISL-65]MBT2550966.1 methyltransferase domain-containing protein [Arthrobacter sp. ISL-65]